MFRKKNAVRISVVKPGTLASLYLLLQCCFVALYRGCTLLASGWCLKYSSNNTMYIQLDCSPSRRIRKINSRINRKGYNKSKTAYGKLLARRIQFCCIYFCPMHFLSLFFEITFHIMPEQKYTLQNHRNIQCRIGFGSSNTFVLRSQVLLRCLGLYGNQVFI